MAPKIIAVIGALDYDMVMVTNRVNQTAESKQMEGLTEIGS
jgi:hypothetical protein